MASKEWDGWVYDTLVRFEEVVADMPGPIDAYRAYRFAVSSNLPAGCESADDRIRRMIRRHEHDLLLTVLECHAFIHELLVLLDEVNDRGES